MRLVKMSGGRVAAAYADVVRSFRHLARVLIEECEYTWAQAAAANADAIQHQSNRNILHLGK